MRISVSLILLCCSLSGCSRPDATATQHKARPRPVSVMTLGETDPTTAFTVAGTVAAWKTEDIGFEVSGRVDFVIEPETNVTGPILGSADEQPLARIDPERYLTSVESAKAQIAVLERQKAAAIVVRDRVLPAEADAALASEQLAQLDFDRMKDLFSRKATSRADVDKASANLKSNQAKVAQLVAQREAQGADVAAIEAEVDKARAQLKDAERDLKDCTLLAPFRGQIAEVHVIPGGSAQRGEPVVTLQMMDPVQVEFEVSASRARRMRYKDSLDVVFTRDDGSQFREEGVIWMTDSTADQLTRTFTIKVLVRNRLITTEMPEDLDPAKTGVTRDIWKLVRGVLGNSEKYYLEKNSIHKDSEGDYVWRIINSAGESKQSMDTVLKAEKVYVTAGTEEVDFLGLWRFRDVAVIDPASFDYENDRVLGQLELPDGLPELVDGTAVFSRQRWGLRPGDLVGVDLSGGRLETGFYVPLNAIAETSGKSFVFAVDDGMARQIEVTVSDGPNTHKRIDPVGDQPLTAGTKIVLGGVHYLSDGEAVNVASEIEVD